MLQHSRREGAGKEEKNILFGGDNAGMFPTVPKEGTKRKEGSAETTISPG